MRLEVLWFAWLRERTGRGRDSVDTQAATVAALVEELRALSEWSEGHVWVSPEMHGAPTGVFKNQIDWLPLNTGRRVRRLLLVVLAMSALGAFFLLPASATSSSRLPAARPSSPSLRRSAHVPLCGGRLDPARPRLMVGVRVDGGGVDAACGRRRAVRASCCR